MFHVHYSEIGKGQQDIIKFAATDQFLNMVDAYILQMNQELRYLNPTKYESVRQFELDHKAVTAKLDILEELRVFIVDLKNEPPSQ